jgi:hypothetical protein
MSDIGDLKERAEKLVQHISLIQSEIRTVDIDTKIDDIKSEIKKLRDDNDRLLRENDELKLSLKSLISSVEDSRLSDLPVTFQGVGKKMDAILEMGRTNGAPAEAATTSRLAVVADIAKAPKEVQVGPSAKKVPDDRWNVPSGVQRTPGSTP